MRPARTADSIEELLARIPELEKITVSTVRTVAVALCANDYGIAHVDVLGLLDEPSHSIDLEVSCRCGSRLTLGGQDETLTHELVDLFLRSHSDHPTTRPADAADRHDYDEEPFYP